MQAAEPDNSTRAQSAPPAGGAATIPMLNNENHMKDDLETMAQQLRAAGHVTYKPAE
ncbi:hypothetical protein IYX23_10465 [Methylocystis sp. L43]|uniref:hypothetical protein n=1 Tax=unclassified Methylocystis TaxID=2625913 RepID=UPI0018C1F622|nr:MULTISPECIES: hypothetical protein [unclassified Methylocystis]MBG0798093.1 hypothetical protein [Methylocystis sp. L43]MBG0805529.1 hypothetical protein [Methylocystis sp. H15]